MLWNFEPPPRLYPHHSHGSKSRGRVAEKRGSRRVGDRDFGERGALIGHFHSPLIERP